MAVTRNDKNQVFRDGVLQSEDVVQTDVTAEAVLFDLAVKVRQAIDANSAFLAIGSPTNAQVLAQTRVLTRECTALIRLMARTIDGLDDLARDTAAT